MNGDERSLGDLLGNSEWVSSRIEQPRIGAEDLVAALSTLAGEDQDCVIETLHKDEPLARTVRKLLELSRREANVGGRPQETGKHLAELAVLVELEKQGLKGKNLYDEARSRLGYGPGGGPDDSTLRRNRKRVLAKFSGPNGIAALMMTPVSSHRKGDKT